MLVAAGEKIQYLSLALDARKAIEALCEFLETGERREGLERSIHDVTGYLAAVQGGGDLYANLHEDSSFEHFEQIQTLDEVETALGDKDLVARLEGVLTAKSARIRRENAKYAIKFFSKLEGRALHHYNQPPDDQLGF
jgi:hypothetical protein